MDREEKIYLKIFLTMMKIGIFTFGGGYAMIALLQNEFVIRKQWISEEEFTDMLVISESTPGSLAINCATYLGYKIGGMSGAFISTLGVVAPSFFLIYVISLFFDQFLTLKYVACAFKGIQVCVVYLIASAGVTLFKGMKKNLFSVVILMVVLFTMIVCSIMAMKLSSILYILLGGLLGYIFYVIKQKKERKSEKI